MDASNPALPRVPWKAGDTIGRYRLLAHLATGGMAEIWLAQQDGPKGFGREVVIKKISDAYLEDPEFIDMFLDEARLAAQLNHPNVVQIFDLGEHLGGYYMAMEYLDGETVAVMARNAKTSGLSLPLPFVARIIASAAEGLDYAHRKVGQDGAPLNIVHRDVSPSNLVMTYDGIVKVVDFGIAKAAKRASHTQAKQVKGKLAYMSPEQVRGEGLDARSDVFALGIILFELLTLTRLFKVEDTFQALAAIGGKAPLPSASDRNPEVPEALAAIVAKALSRERESRFQTAHELSAALEGWLRTVKDAPSAAELSAYMRTTFADRIQKRARLLEQARAGATPDPMPEVLLSKTPSMPGSTDPGVAVPADGAGGQAVSPDAPRHASKENVVLPTHAEAAVAPRRRSSRAPLAVGVVAAVALGAAVVWFLGRGREVAAPAVAPAPPRTAVGRLTVRTEPPGASVSINGKDRGTAPLVVDDVEVGEVRVLAVLPDRLPASRTLTLRREGEALELALELPAPPAVRPPEPARPVTPPKVVGQGKLTLDTTPWATVYEGERRLGDTPLIKVPIVAGRHVLKLVNPEKGVRTTVVVEIRAGQLTVKKLQL